MRCGNILFPIKKYVEVLNQERNKNGRVLLTEVKT